jgi:MoxR-like ATPase
MFNVIVDYPSLDEEKKIINQTAKDEPAELAKLLTGKTILNLQKLVRSVPVSDYVTDYVVKLVRATRPKDDTAPDFVKRMVDYGAGVRAGQYLVRAGQAFAAMDGRYAISVEDVKRAAIPVLRHRIGANFQAQAEGKTSDDIIKELLAVVPTKEPEKYVAMPGKRKLSS